MHVETTLDNGYAELCEGLSSLLSITDALAVETFPQWQSTTADAARQELADIRLLLSNAGEECQQAIVDARQHQDAVEEQLAVVAGAHPNFLTPWGGGHV